ncbi:PepSY domain-containing protein [Photobacterium alginatilyticum]|uniref:PepSY domain-containing protein n=1 Tax=Photobacterium alginatilyticum TaxID=1775171 RepID=A0ABW9YJU1_9GAMM|nr:PepSY domain-containing protein [Photobacterium alginatilyticum]NBI54030.1 PepSY domain-containing protein [Photobacterium alginatilyticum]
MKVLSVFASWVCLGSLLAAVPAMADPVEETTSSALTVPKAMRMLQNQGYHDFRKIKVEREENEIEVEARDKEGRKVELEIDLYTGKITDID